MNWYIQIGKNSDVVLNTKTVYLRNLINFKFNTKNREEIAEIERIVKSKLQNIGYNLNFLKMSNIDEITKESLLEKGIISEKILEDKQNKTSLLVNDEENICIVINGENHFEIQVFNSGMEIENTFNLAREIETKFENEFDIAKSKKYGYLTTSPTEVGTGLKIEVTVHLPGLNKTGNITKIMQTVNNFGLNFNAKYIYNQESIGDIYIISNKRTLGITEEGILQNVSSILEKIIEQERQARKLLGTNEIELEDMIYRKYGIISNAKKIKWEETINLMSDIKMGTDLGILDELNDEKVAKIYYYTQKANLQKYIGEELDAYNRDIKRAEIIKQIIKE